MAVIRSGKISEVAADAQAWIERTYEDADMVSVGHVMVVIEMRHRVPDNSSKKGHSVNASIAVWADDARNWVRNALLTEALDAQQEASFEIPIDEEDE